MAKNIKRKNLNTSINSVLDTKIIELSDKTGIKKAHLLDEAIVLLLKKYETDAKYYCS